jgi:hypothetical protein
VFGGSVHLNFLLLYLRFESFTLKRPKATDFEADESLSLKASLRVFFYADFNYVAAFLIATISATTELYSR